MALRPLGFLLLLLTSCTAAADDTMTCTDQGCVPSYRAHLESPQTDLEVGLWRVELDIDGAVISATCMASGPNDGPESIVCDLGPWTDEPDRPLDVFVSINTRIGPGSGEPTDSGDPPEESNQGIFVDIQSNDEEAPVIDLGIVVEFEGEVVLQTTRSPTYALQEDFNGPGCGSCLRDVEEVLELP